MVAHFLKTFRILREHRVAVSHPQLSRSDSPGCPSWAKTPKFLWKNKRDLGLHRQWPPCPVPLPAVPLSPCHLSTLKPTPPSGFPGHAHSSAIRWLFEYVPLTYDLEMSAGMENPGHSQQELCPGTFSNGRSPSAWPFTVVFYFYLPLSYFSFCIKTSLLFLLLFF